MFLLPHKQDEVWEAWTCLKGRAMIWFDLLAVEELVFFFLLGWAFFYLRPPLVRINEMFKRDQEQIVLNLHPPSVADRAG